MKIYINQTVQKNIKCMDFYIVFVKNRKKFDKYVKINKIRNKVIIDIKQQLDEHGLDNNVDEWKEYFNLIIYTKITQTIRKKRDVYYIPNVNKINEIEIEDIFQIKDNLLGNVSFNLLFFYEDFKEHQVFHEKLFSNISLFDAIQIIRDY